MKEMPRLTKSEEELMELFWQVNNPLTSVELLDIATGHSWNGHYIHKILNSLLKKGFIEICGYVLYGSQYTRQFITIITEDDYISNYILLRSTDNKTISKVMVTMAKKAMYSEELIKTLEGIVEDYIKKEESKSEKAENKHEDIDE